MMRYTSIAGVPKPVSRLVLGTMIISTQELDRSFALLDAALAQGYTTLDTAYVYAGGESERCIGQWMVARRSREQVVIVSKGCHPRAGQARVTPANLAADLEESLARLQTGYVDVYLLHRDDPSVPVGPIVEAFNEHHRAGRIHAFGGSNWTHQRLAEANAYAAAHNLIPFTVSSPNYGLADQIADPWGPGCVSLSGPANREARAWYQAAGMPVLAYSSLARGLFSGRITPENFEQQRHTLDQACLTAYCHPPNMERLRRATQLAADKGVTVPQIVLAFLFASPLNVLPIVGAASETELRENGTAFDLTLTPTECAWLDLESDSL